MEYSSQNSNFKGISIIFFKKKVETFSCPYFYNAVILRNQPKLKAPKV